jgi:hypothetical protein
MVVAGIQQMMVPMPKCHSRAEFRIRSNVVGISLAMVVVFVVMVVVMVRIGTRALIEHHIIFTFNTCCFDFSLSSCEIGLPRQIQITSVHSTARDKLNCGGNQVDDLVGKNMISIPSVIRYRTGKAMVNT